MDLYSSTHPGLAISDQEMTTLKVTGRIADGYVAREDLLKLNSRSILSAGIRVYKSGKAARANGAASLVICGTKADGFDANEKAGLSFNPPIKDPLFLKIAPPQQLNGSQPVAEQLSREEAKKVVTIDTFTTAFFSWTVIFDLLADQTTDGISFFEVQLDPIKIRVPELVVPTKYDFLSFVAVASRISDAKSKLTPQKSSRRVLSNLPCPGHCLNIGAGGRKSRSSVARSENTSGSFRRPYLNPWE